MAHKSPSQRKNDKRTQKRKSDRLNSTDRNTKQKTIKRKIARMGKVRKARKDAMEREVRALAKLR